MNCVFKILPVIAVLFSAACAQKTDQPAQTTATETSKPETEDTLSPEVPASVPVINSITGVVASIQLGKDGYTAKVHTTRRETVLVTVSRVNLKDPAQYRSVKVGDTLQVIGEAWEMNGETHLKALELK
jgi:hypothetical protein